MLKLSIGTSLVMSILLLCSCGSTSPDAVDPGHQGNGKLSLPESSNLAGSAEQSVAADPVPAELPAGLSQGLPPLPSGRILSGLLETSRTGEQSFSRSSSAVPLAPALALSAPAGMISWGIWELPAVDELRYLNVQLSTPGALPGNGGAYIAVANYATGHWEFQGPVYESRVLQLDPLGYASPGGALYVAVLVADGDSASVQQLSLVVFHANAAPAAALEADATSGNAPLSVNFDASATTDPDNNIARYLWDWDGNGGIDEQSISPLVSHVFTAGGSFSVSVTAEDSDGERDSAAVSIDVNASPKAVIEIPANVVDRFETISLQGGSSTDGDGSIVQYEWDTDGIAGFETNSGSQNSIGFGANKAGRLTLRLRVTDDSGATDIASAELYVRGYNIEAVDDQAFAGIHTEIAVVNGRPAVCYEAGFNSTLFYSRASDANGSAWGTPVEIDPVVNTGQYNSMIMVNGRPAISYFDQTNGSLKYVRSSDANGDSWPGPQTLESSGPGMLTGSHTSMAMVGGRPAIVYAHNGGENHYIRAADSNGTSWIPYVTIDNGPGNVGYFNSLAIVNGNPAVSYQHWGSEDLLYRRALNADGTVWGPRQTLDSATETGFFTSLKVIEGRPTIAYYDNTGKDLRYISAYDADGAGWRAPLTIDASGSTGQYAQLDVLNGMPVIAYHNSSVGQLLFVRASLPDGTAWGMPEVIDGALPNVLGGYCSLGTLNGSPIFSYKGVRNGLEDVVGFAIGY
jgi:PKD repeat protein